MVSLIIGKITSYVDKKTKHKHAPQIINIVLECQFLVSDIITIVLQSIIILKYIYLFIICDNN